MFLAPNNVFFIDGFDIVTHPSVTFVRLADNQIKISYYLIITSRVWQIAHIDLL